MTTKWARLTWLEERERAFLRLAWSRKHLRSQRERVLNHVAIIRGLRLALDAVCDAEVHRLAPPCGVGDDCGVTCCVRKSRIKLGLAFEALLDGGPEPILGPLTLLPWMPEGSAPQDTARDTDTADLSEPTFSSHFGDSNPGPTVYEIAGGSNDSEDLAESVSRARRSGSE